VSALAPLVGHEEPRRALSRAALAGELPGSLLVHGPPGVGKQRLALWLAQLLTCAAPAAGEPCGGCTACRLALRLEHPDLHWFFPLPRPKGASGPERLAAALEQARAAELAARRAQPLRAVASGEALGIYLAQVQQLRRLAAARPAMGSRRIFIVGDAELLVPQESSPEAANALLKVLEEPPPEATFILTASDPEALLPTLRSRVLPVRLSPLLEPVVAAVLEERAGVPTDAARLAARLGAGSIGRALAFLPDGKEPGALEAVRARARGWLQAAAAAPAAPRHAAAHAAGATGARGIFADVLDAFVLWLRDLGAAAAGAEEQIVNVDALPLLRRLAADLPAGARGVPAALQHAEEARAMVRTNVNPSLALGWLLRAVHRDLRGA
jgi:DNA polymerase III subunit delta'